MDMGGGKLLGEGFTKETISRKMELLIFVGNILDKAKGIFISPEFIAENSNGFHLLNFSATE
jgi:hypothetical protein